MVTDRKTSNNRLETNRETDILTNRTAGGRTDRQALSQGILTFSVAGVLVAVPTLLELP